LTTTRRRLAHPIKLALGTRNWVVNTEANGPTFTGKPALSRPERKKQHNFCVFDAMSGETLNHSAFTDALLFLKHFVRLKRYFYLFSRVAPLLSYTVARTGVPSSAATTVATSYRSLVGI